MKFFKDPVYYCSHCKSLVEKVDDLYFVEETSPRSFCSEKCIEEYYFPLIDIFENQKNTIREELGILEEELEELLSQPEYIDGLFSTPTEIWTFENLLKEEIYIYIKHVKKDNEDIFFISLCLVFNFRPSFILAVDVTKNSQITDLYRMGKKLEDLSEFLKAASSSEDNSLEISLEDIERRKASLLATLLTFRKETDISVENFHLYDTYLFPTIENGDLVSLWESDEGDSYHVCSKAFELDGNSFYYIVICFPHSIEGENFIPILGFPTLDGQLYSDFTNGERLSGILKN